MVNIVYVYLTIQIPHIWTGSTKMLYNDINTSDFVTVGIGRLSTAHVKCRCLAIEFVQFKLHLVGKS